MIIDHLSNIKRYACMGINYAKAVEFLANTDLKNLPFGRTDIDGDNVFANLSDNYLNREEMAWEAHQRYADIQLILHGEERFGWADKAEYGQLDGDFQVCYPQTEPVVCTLKEGQFIIFLPNEPHSPGNYVNMPGNCLKLVVKVLHQDL